MYALRQMRHSPVFTLTAMLTLALGIGATTAIFSLIHNNWGDLFFRPGSDTPNISDPMSVMVSWNRVSPGYLETMGQKIVRGRTISEQDTAATRNVAVVDEALVKKYFKPDEDPIRQVFGIDEPKFAKIYEIVGVVHTANYTDPMRT